MSQLTCSADIAHSSPSPLCNRRAIQPGIYTPRPRPSPESTPATGRAVRVEPSPEPAGMGLEVDIDAARHLDGRQSPPVMIPAEDSSSSSSDSEEDGGAAPAAQPAGDLSDSDSGREDEDAMEEEIDAAMMEDLKMDYVPPGAVLKARFQCACTAAAAAVPLVSDRWLLCRRTTGEEGMRKAAAQRAKQEPSEMERCYLETIDENNKVIAFMMTLTVLALFGDDLRILILPNSADAFMSALWFCVLLLFGLEWLAQCWFKPDYRWSLFFYLDLIATLSLVTDVIFLADLIFGATSHIDTAQQFCQPWNETLDYGEHRGGDAVAADAGGGDVRNTTPPACHGFS